MNDLRFAWRQLAKSPGFASVAILIIALGVAGNTVVFTIVNGLFLRPLPFPRPAELVDIDETAPKWNLRYTGINYADFEAWRAHNQTFAGMATYRTDEFSLAIAGRSARVPGQRVTHDLAAVLGIAPVIGRMFRVDEELRNGPRVALIGHHVWTEWFDRDRAIVGKTITIDAEPYEIIGVLPASAVIPSRAALWIPFASRPPQWGGFAVGRLKPGVTIDQASADLLRIHRARIPEAKENEITSPIIQPLTQRFLGGAVFIATLLQGGVLMLLLIASANAAGLLLARTFARAPEFALRAALGASGPSLVRQLVVESLMLAVIGGGAGILLGHWLLDALLPLFPDLPAWLRIEMDWRFALFVIVLVLGCGLAASVLPAHHVVHRLDLRDVLGAGTAQTTASVRRVFALRALVVGEIALALVLLLVAGLFIRAAIRVRQIEPGLRPERMLTYTLLLPPASYRGNATRIAFFEQHLARVRARPEVESASASTALPFSGQHMGNFFEPEGGLPGGPDAKAPVVLTRMSFPGYFATMGIAVQAGRDFDAQDWRYKIIVNETLARLFWPGEEAVGKRMRSRGSQDPWLEVIGVARDVKHYGLESEVRPGVYVPFYAMPRSSVSIVVRTRGDPVALGPIVRTLLQEQDPLLPIAGLATMEERIRDSQFLRRMYSGMTAAFAVIAVTMAMGGLYGVIAYVVGRRTREFGIRLALGAHARDLRLLVLHEGARLATVGVVLGLAAGVLTGFAMSRLLVGVSPLDPLVLFATVVVLSASVLAACLLPARRATRLNVLDVLRAE